VLMRAHHKGNLKTNGFSDDDVEELLEALPLLLDSLVSNSSGHLTGHKSTFEAHMDRCRSTPFVIDDDAFPPSFLMFNRAMRGPLISFLSNPKERVSRANLHRLIRNLHRFAFKERAAWIGSLAKQKKRLLVSTDEIGTSHYIERARKQQVRANTIMAGSTVSHMLHRSTGRKGAFMSPLSLASIAPSSETNQVAPGEESENARAMDVTQQLSDVMSKLRESVRAEAVMLTPAGDEAPPQANPDGSKGARQVPRLHITSRKKANAANHSPLSMWSKADGSPAAVCLTTVQPVRVENLVADSRFRSWFSLDAISVLCVPVMQLSYGKPPTIQGVLTCLNKRSAGNRTGIAFDDEDERDAIVFASLLSETVFGIGAEAMLQRQAAAVLIQSYARVLLFIGRTRITRVDQVRSRPGRPTSPDGKAI